MPIIQNSQPGPWQATPHTGSSGARYFAIERRNSKVWGGYEIMLTSGYKPRRFDSIEAAQKAADKANDATGSSHG